MQNFQSLKARFNKIKMRDVHIVVLVLGLLFFLLDFDAMIKLSHYQRENAARHLESQQEIVAQCQSIVNRLVGPTYKYQSESFKISEPGYRGSSISRNGRTWRQALGLGDWYVRFAVHFPTENEDVQLICETEISSSRDLDYSLWGSSMHDTADTSICQDDRWNNPVRCSQ